MILEILESGQALYALAAVCALGILSRLTARTLYRRLIRETDNMALTKNRYLREFKQKAENTYRLNQGLNNTQVYLEKQIASYRFLGISLNGWGNLSGQMTVLCFLLGGVGAFLSYWYQSDSYYIIMYGSMGILAGLLTLFLDFGVNLSEKRSQLVCVLQDYLENSLFCRLARETAAAEEGPRAVNRESVVLDGGRAAGNGRASGLRGGILRNRADAGDSESEAGARDKGSAGDRGAGRDISRTGGSRESGVSRGSIRSISRSRAAGDAPDTAGGDYDDNDRTAGRTARRGSAGRGSAKDPEEVMALMKEKGGIDPDYLRRSLEQIAASREKSRSEDWLKDLSPDELELVGEILKQYLE